MSIYINELSLPLIKKSQEQSHSIWNHGFTLEDRTNLLLNRMGVYGPQYIRMSGLTDENGNLLSSMKRYKMMLTVSGTAEKYLAAGFGAIFTEEGKRAQGYARSLIENVIRESEKEGIEACVLFSDIDPSYYSRLGFRQFDARNFEIDLNSLPGNTPELTSRLATEKDFLQLNHFFEKNPPNESGKIKTSRDEKTWRIFRELNGVSQPDLILESPDQTAIGYLSYAVQKNKMMIGELSITKEYLEQAWAKIRAIAQNAQVETIYGWYHDGMIPSSIMVKTELSSRRNAVPMIKMIRGQGSRLKIEEFAPEQASFHIVDHF